MPIDTKWYMEHGSDLLEKQNQLGRASEMKSRHSLFIILILAASLYLLGPKSCLAGGITVSQSVDKTEIKFDDEVTLEIRLEWNGPQSAYLFHRPVTPDFDLFKVGRFSSTVSSTGSGKEEVTTKLFRYSLIPNLSGKAVINPIELNYLSWPDSIEGKVSTEAISIKIAEPKFKENRSNGGTQLYLWLAIGGAILLVGAGMFISLRKREPKETVLVPAVMFLDKLGELKRESGSDIKKFQSGLFGLLHSFIKRECELEVAGLSTEKLIACLENSKFTIAQREKIGGWLERAEREKYQPAASAPGETTRLEADIRAYFEQNFL